MELLQEIHGTELLQEIHGAASRNPWHCFNDSMQHNLQKLMESLQGFHRTLPSCCLHCFYCMFSSPCSALQQSLHLRPTHWLQHCSNCLHTVLVLVVVLVVVVVVVLVVAVLVVGGGGGGGPAGYAPKRSACMTLQKTALRYLHKKLLVVVLGGVGGGAGSKATTRTSVLAPRPLQGRQCWLQGHYKVVSTKMCNCSAPLPTPSCVWLYDLQPTSCLQKT